jgi:hypothetical protein
VTQVPEHNSVPDDGLEEAVAEVEELAQDENEDHERRLQALDRLHFQLETELEESTPDPDPGQ